MFRYVKKAQHYLKFYMVEYVEVILVPTVEIFRMFPIPEFLDMNFQPALLRRMKMNMESNRE
jgi:hypothetical protein